MPQRRRRKRVGESTVTAVIADAPNRVWVDFQFDATEDGRPVKIAVEIGMAERWRLADTADTLSSPQGRPVPA